MNTRTIIGLLIALSLLLFCAMAVLSLPDKLAISANPPADAQAAIPATTPSAGVAMALPGADEETEAAIADMLPLLGACANALYTQGAQALDAKDAALVWQALSYACPEGGVVSRETLLGVYARCFAGGETLPAPPKTEQAIAYDKAKNEYSLPAVSPAGSCALTDVRVYTGLADAYGVACALLSGAGDSLQLLGTYAFTLQRDAGEFRLLEGREACNLMGYILAAEDTADGMRLQVRPATLDVPHHFVNPTGEPDQTLLLWGAQAVDAAMLCLLLGEQNVPGEDEGVLLWFRENCTREAGGMPIAYQMKVYQGVIYGITPLYDFYFSSDPAAQDAAPDG